MVKIKIEISGDEDIIFSGMEFHPDIDKICINIRVSENRSQNIVVKKGETAKFEFDTNIIDLMSKANNIKNITIKKEKK